MRDKLADTEHRLKGVEATLEEARDEAEGERAITAVLRTSLGEIKSQQEAAKERVANEAVVVYLQSKAFNDETMKYFISGFETLHRRALRIYLGLNLFMLRADAELTSVVLEPNEEAVADQEKDDSTS